MYRKGALVRAHPTIAIEMCDKEALEPASRVFKTEIGAARRKRRVCPPHLFPPDGKGIWQIRKSAKPAEQIIQRLDPLLTTEFKTKWQRLKQTCRPPRPVRPYRRKRKR